jgi:hypothetical protein
LYFLKRINNNKNNLLLLNKALYELKQLARIWYFTLYNVLIQIGFEMLKIENYIFINKLLNIILCVYINNITIINFNNTIINESINKIKKHFNIKNLSLIKNYLSIFISFRILSNKALHSFL